MELAAQVKTRHFLVEHGLLLTFDRRVYVPKFGFIRRLISKERYDEVWSRHPGQRHTRELIETIYFWPRMWDGIECYVQTCLVCQQDKVEQRQSGGLVKLLPVAERPWESVTMDFNTSLLKSNRFGMIMVVADRFSKYVTFMPATVDCTVKEDARLFFKNMVKYWGLSRHISSDRYLHFTGNFWRELFKIVGTELHLSISFHPQTDNKTKNLNALLECYLRHYVTAHQNDWARLLDMAQFSYNLQRSESTWHTPFELTIG